MSSSITLSASAPLSRLNRDLCRTSTKGDKPHGIGIVKEEERKQTIAQGAPMGMLELRHYTIRFRESERLGHRLPRLVWRFLSAHRLKGCRPRPADR
jgi:hypothetical protein